MATYSSGSNSLPNTGVNKNKGDQSRLYRFWFVPSEFAFDTEADAKDKSKFEAAVKNGDIRVFPIVHEIEPQNKEKTTKEYSSGHTIKTAKAKRKTRFRVSESESTHRNLIAYDGLEGQIYEITEEGNIRGTVTDQGKYAGLPVKIEVNIQNTGSFSEIPDTDIDIEYLDYEDWDVRGFCISPDYSPKAIDGVNDIELIVLAAATTGLTVQARVKGETFNLVGLTASNFEILDSGDNLITIDAVTDANNEGVYLIDTTTVPMATGSHKIRTKEVGSSLGIVGLAGGYYQGLNGAVAIP